MLLLLTLALKGSIVIAPMPPIPTPTLGGGGVATFQSYNSNNNSKELLKEETERRKKEECEREKIITEDSELVAIVELTLRNFII